MKLWPSCLCASIFLVGVVLGPNAFGQPASPGVTGSGNATFTAATSFAGIALVTLDFGAGIEIPGDTSATGHFHTTLQGSTVAIEVDCRVSAGSISPSGASTFSGACSVDLGNGSAPSTGVAFAALAVPDGNGRGTLTLTLGSSKLPAAAIQDGILTIRP
jgi:hypothetical protein